MNGQVRVSVSVEHNHDVRRGGGGRTERVLVSERVVNWTLSNYQRRIEIKVGVAYGNDPTTVIGVLEGAVNGILIYSINRRRERSSRASATAASTSRCGVTDHQDVFAAVRSRVAIAVHDALRDAGSRSVPTAATTCEVAGAHTASSRHRA